VTLPTLEVPFAAGAGYRYQVDRPASVEPVVVELVTVLAEFDGQKAWAVQQLERTPEATTSSVLYLEPGQLTPLYYERSVQAGAENAELRATFGSSRVTVDRINTEGRQGSYKIEASGPVYARVQLALLARALPLQEGYRETVPYINNEAGAVGTAEFRVEGRELLSVPAGDYTTWRVRMTLRTDSSSEARVAWFDTGGAQALVRYEVGNELWVLSQAQG
jgi:hypothetical protein